jgi:hypothetical protein
MNLKSYGVLHPPKLPLNAYANVVQDEFPEKELARIGKGSMVHKEAPILRETWLSGGTQMTQSSLPGGLLRCAGQAENKC